MLKINAAGVVGLSLMLAIVAVAGCDTPTPHVVQVYEAENLPVHADAWAGTQPNCCDVVWSNSAQLFFKATDSGQSASVEFNAPYDDTYRIDVVETTSWDYGNVQFSVDGRPVGPLLYGYSPTVQITSWNVLGSVNLSRGSHSLTLTVIGRSAASAGYFAGLDRIRIAN